MVDKFDVEISVNMRRVVTLAACLGVLVIAVATPANATNVDPAKASPTPLFQSSRDSRPNPQRAPRDCFSNELCVWTVYDYQSPDPLRFRCLLDVRQPLDISADNADSWINKTNYYWRWYDTDGGNDRVTYTARPGEQFPRVNNPTADEVECIKAP